MTELRQRMIEDMRLRGLSARTQEAYVRSVRQLAEHYGRSPDLITEDELRAYFLHLVQDKKLARPSPPQGEEAVLIPSSLPHLDGQRHPSLPRPHSAVSLAPPAMVDRCVMLRSARHPGPLPPLSAPIGRSHSPSKTRMPRVSRQSQPPSSFRDDQGPR